MSLSLIMTMLAGCYVNDIGDMGNDNTQDSGSENAQVNVDKELVELQERVELFESQINPMIEKCSSASEMQSYIDQIKDMPQVKNAWVENEIFCLEDKSGLLHAWDFEDPENFPEEIIEENTNKARIFENTRSSDSETGKGKRVCLIFGETNYNWKTNRDFLLKLFNQYGFSEVVSIEEKRFSPDFLLSEDFLNYDIYFIRTHGAFFKNKHWLLTNSYELSTIGKFINNYIAEHLGETLYKSDFESLISDKIAVMHSHYGIHTNGKGTTYYVLSEKFFSDFVFKKSTFTKNPIIFNATCETMAVNNDLAKIIVDEGKARAYLGYTITQGHGNFAGMELFRLMLENHYTLDGALTALKHQYGLNGYYIVLDEQLEKYGNTTGVSYNPQSAIDMGGKVKWAQYNIGAVSELELGDSLRWGEIHPWNVWIHRFTNTSYERIKKNDPANHYDTDYEYNYPQNNIGGNDKQDPATAYLGEGWRLPTKEDFEDLLYSGKNEVRTITVTSPNYLLISNKNNGNQIVLPYPDFNWTFTSFVTHYWTSDIYNQDNNEKEAWAFLPVGVPPFYQSIMSDCPGYLAGFVRPVYTK